VFWPFAFGDIFSFAFWPYYDPFWDYGPDFIYASLFWPYGDEDYAYYGRYYRFGDIYAGSRRAPVTAAESSTDIAETCGGVAPGLTDLPMERIEQALQPSGEQRASFDDLKAASAKAEEIMKVSCSNEIPLTPLSRLDAVEKRVDAMIQAVQTLRAPLDTFYDSLTDEQKRRLDSLAEGQDRAGRDLAQFCSASASQFTALPSEQIQQTVQPNGRQRSALEALKSASTRAADVLNGTCPTQTPSTPAARLDAMAKRLDATAQAVNTMRPALQDFYASLDDEQKARFSTMDQQAQHQG
jgi:predicted transcriptional regulator